MKFIDFLSYISFSLIGLSALGWLIWGGATIITGMFWVGVLLLIGILVFIGIAILSWFWNRGQY